MSGLINMAPKLIFLFRLFFNLSFGPRLKKRILLMNFGRDDI